MLYSEELEGYNQKLPEAVEEALEEIKGFFSIDTLTILKYDDNHIVVPVVFNVSIPSGGTVGGIDIREQEPFLIKISIVRFPNEIPLLLSDRKDFPRKNLSHLYVSKKPEEPAKLCIVRNNPSEWFSGKRISDLLAVGEQWLFKAAIGRLSNDGNEFDPTRLEGYTGYHLYRYNLIHDLVKNNERLIENHSMALLLTYLYKYEDKDELIYRTIGVVPFIQLNKAIEIVKKGNSESEKLPIAGVLFSIAVWRDDDVIESEYCTSLPKTYGGLKVYFSLHGIDIEKTINLYVKNGLKFLVGIPIIHAIKRPCKMVGYDGNYEFINFTMNGKDFNQGKFPDDAIVYNQSHIEPFSKNLANKLTLEDRDDRTLFIGAGSLGSKIIIHDARSGKLKLGVVDNDEFLQHNLARHVLFQDKVGKNKAKAIVKEISDFYETDSQKEYQSYEINATNLDDETLKNYDWIVDTSASTLVQNFLCFKILPKEATVSRCEIVDKGNLGLLYIEGKDRNPRLDDLVNLTYFLSLQNKELQDWRMNDAEREITNIDIGLGCSSTTTIMSDDTISFHAAIFSKLLYNESQRKTIKEKGLIYLSSLETTSIPSLKSNHYLIEPFNSFTCNANSKWEVRMIAGLSARLLELCKQKGNIETGGALIGMANYKTKTIHVFDIIVEPQGSRGTCTGFLRGNIGLPEEINKIKKTTGGVIGYIGEWHTHPMNMETLSSTDIHTIQELVKINNKTPIPTCAIIITNDKVLPFIFE